MELYTLPVLWCLFGFHEGSAVVESQGLRILGLRVQGLGFRV